MICAIARPAVTGHSLWTASAVLCVCLLFAPHRATAQEPKTTWSVVELQARPGDWIDLRGKTIRIEGRYSSMGRETMRMLNSDISFKLPPGFVRPPGESRNIEVIGVLQQDSAGWNVQVTRVDARPSDSDALALRRKILPRTDPQVWFELATWARQRADFYDDSLLKRMAEDTQQTALEILNETLVNDSGEGYLKWGQLADSLSLDPRRRDALIFTGLSRLWKNGRGAPNRTLSQMAEIALQLLPGARLPGEPLPAQTLTRFQADPVPTYVNATDGDRRLMERLFYVEVAAADLLSRVSPDDSNASQIAALFRRDLPERSTVADELDERQLALRIRQIPTSTRTEALALVDDLKKLNREADAKRALATWLKERGQRALREGLSSVYQVADDYVLLAADKAAAGKLLLEADRRFPDIPETKQRLEALGYRRDGDSWVNTPLAPADRDPVADAMRLGKIAVGMTREQVYKTLGSPTSTVRALSRAGLTETWTYQDAGLSVKFERGSGMSEPKVVEQISTRTRRRP